MDNYLIFFSFNLNDFHYVNLNKKTPAVKWGGSFPTYITLLLNTVKFEAFDGIIVMLDVNHIHHVTI
jgi:hypothetical protein